MLVGDAAQSVNHSHMLLSPGSYASSSQSPGAGALGISAVSEEGGYSQDKEVEEEEEEEVVEEVVEEIEEHMAPLSPTSPVTAQFGGDAQRFVEELSVHSDDLGASEGDF